MGKRNCRIAEPEPELALSLRLSKSTYLEGNNATFACGISSTPTTSPRQRALANEDVARRQQTFADLRAYCERDTWATLELHKALAALAESA